MSNSDRGEMGNASLLSSSQVDLDALQAALDAFDLSQAVVPRKADSHSISELVGVDVVPGTILRDADVMIAPGEAYFDVRSGDDALTDSTRADIIFTQEGGSYVIVQVKTAPI